jgi:hypothetical protein
MNRNNPFTIIDIFLSIDSVMSDEIIKRYRIVNVFIKTSSVIEKIV